MEFKYDLTIGMIVKNEEKALEKCLKALEPLRKQINCELIITDTGSTDKTIEIAQKYADKVLEFEWCDDFAKARNTAVEISQGRWFMYVDADETFDKSVTEIAKFINSPNSVEYDNATFSQRNIIDNDRKKYNDFNALRLCNFTKEKKYFIFKIHETIPRGDKIFHINAVAWHTGYSGEIFGEKRVRNRRLLEEELQNDPNNIRYIKQIIDISEDEEEKIDLANKALDLFKSKQGKNPEVILSIYNFIARMHLSNKKFDEVVEISNEFFQIKMFETKSLPFMEMAWVTATALINLGKNVEALRMYELYKSHYEFLHDNSTNLYSSIDVYTTNKETIYYNSYLMTVECLRKIGEVNKACQVLETLNFYEFRDNNNDYYLLNLYLKNVILFNNDKLFKKVDNFVNRAKINVYDGDKYVLFMIAKIHFDSDITDFVKKYSKEDFVKMFFVTFNSAEELILPIHRYFVRKLRFLNAKECEYHTEAMHLYCLHGLKRLKDNDKKEILKDAQTKITNSLLSGGLFDQLEKKAPKYKRASESDRITNQVIQIFELLIKYNYEFLKKSQDIKMLKETGYDNIDHMQAMTIIIYEGLSNKANDISSYSASLKESIPYARRYISLIQFSIDLIDGNIEK